MALGASASAQTMHVELANGESVDYATSDIKAITFSGAQAQGTRFEVSVTNVTATTAHLTVRPDNAAARYYFDCALLSDFESKGAKAIVEGYIASIQRQYPSLSMEQILKAALSQGFDEDEVSGLPCNTDMVCYAIEVNDNGECVGEASYTAFRTLEGGDPADCTFDISYTGLTTTALTVNVTPSDYSVRYWMGIYSASGWPGDVAMPMLVKSELEDYAKQQNVNLANVVQGVTFAGQTSTAESGLTAGTAYYIYVYAMAANGDPAGSLTKVRFTTPLQDYSEAGVTLSYRWFDGDALQAAHPDEFNNANGRAILQAVFTPNANTAHWAWAMAKGDLTDTVTYPDESTKNAVVQGGFKDVATKNLYVDWGTATFLYFGADEYGIDGPLQRTLVEVTRDGVRPVSEYDSAATGASVAPKMMLAPKSKIGITLRDKQSYRR